MRAESQKNSKEFLSDEIRNKNYIPLAGVLACGSHIFPELFRILAAALV
jgi:hypothetical protein